MRFVLVLFVCSSSLKLRVNDANCIVEWMGNVTKGHPCWVDGSCAGNNGIKTNIRGNIQALGALLLPKTLAEVQSMVASNDKILMTGTWHSTGPSTAPPDKSSAVMSMWQGDFRKVSLNTCQNTITIGPGVSHADVAAPLLARGKSMRSWLFAKDFSIIGLMTNNAMGLANGQPMEGAAKATTSITAVNGAGNIVTYKKGQLNFRAYTMSLGELGAITSATFDITEDMYDVQDCSMFNNYEQLNDLMNMSNPVFPGEGKPFNDLSGTYEVGPLTDACWTIGRYWVADGLPKGFEDICKAYVVPNLDFNPLYRLFNQMKNFPAVEQGLVDLAHQITKVKPSIVQDAYANMFKKFPNETAALVLPPWPAAPAKMTLCWKYSAIEGVPAQWDLPALQPQWAEFHVLPGDNLNFVNKLRNFMSMTANVAVMPISAYGRVGKNDDPDIPLFSPLTANIIRNLLTGMGAAWSKRADPLDQFVMDNWFKSLMCKMQCEEPIVPIHGYHMGLYVPPDIAASPGLVNPMQNILETFWAIEAEQDPSNKFQTMWGSTYRKRLENFKNGAPNTICHLCGTPIYGGMQEQKP